MANIVIAMLDYLGGPGLTEAEIDWVADLPAGRDLLDFLASQVQPDCAVGLRDVALEKEEADMWHHAVQTKLVTLDPPSFTPASDTTLTRTPPDYIAPSVLRSQLVGIENEQALLDHQLKLLDGRIARARNTTRVDKQMDKAVSAARNQTSLTILHLEEQLSEISLRTDSTVSSAVQCVSQLVGELSITDHKDGQHAYQHIKELSMLLEAFSAISSDLARLSSARFQRDSSDSLAETYIESLRAEVQRLARAIQELENKYVAVTLEEQCKSLENGENWEMMLSPTDSPLRSNIRVAGDHGWVEAVVAKAWTREQAVDLRHRTDCLKQIADLLEDELLPPLALIHASLSMSDASGEETLVAIQALVDELDDMEADLEPAEGSREPGKKTHPSDALEERTKELLKRLRESRPADLPSLVLMERKDVLSELSDVRARYAHALADVTTLCSVIPHDLSSLHASSQVYLSALTVHSPMTTVPPISLPLEVQHQVSKARFQIEAVSHALRQMPNEHPRDSRARRKLDSFVEMNGC